MGNKWKFEEDQLLKTNNSIEELLILLPHRTENSIIGRLYRLKIKKIKNKNIRYWTKDDDNFIIINKNDIEILKIKFFNRSIKSIKYRIYKLTSTKKQVLWSNTQLEYLKTNYSILNTKNISKFLNIPIKIVQKKARMLKLYKLKKPQKISKITIKKNKRILTFDIIQNIAKKYNSRGDFQNADGSAYNTARKKGWLDEVCDHMLSQKFSTPQIILQIVLDTILNIKSLYDTRKIISPYELDVYYPDFKLAIEYNGKGWHGNSKNNKKSKYVDKRDIIKKQLCLDKEITLIIISERSRKYEEDVKQQLIENLDLINKNTNNNFTSEDILSVKVDYAHLIMNLNDVKVLCDSYTNYSKWKNENNSLYEKLCKLKLIDKFTSHMNRKNTQWTDERIKEEISKYEYLCDFRNKSRSCHRYCYENNIEVNLKKYHYPNNDRFGRKS